MTEAEAEEDVEIEETTETAEAEAEEDVEIEETTEAAEAEAEEQTETAEAETEEPVKAIKKDEAPAEAAEKEGTDKTEEPVRMRAFPSSLFMTREGIVVEGAEEQTEPVAEEIKKSDATDAEESEEQTAAVAEEIKDPVVPLAEKPAEVDLTETAPAEEVQTLGEPATEKPFVSQRVRSMPNIDTEADTAAAEEAGEADGPEETDALTDELTGVLAGGLDRETWNAIFGPEESFHGLQRGDTGEDVKALQNILQELGYPIDEADGSYGPQTEQAVKEFQRINGLNPDGSFGKETADALFDDPLPFDEE